MKTKIAMISVASALALGSAGVSAQTTNQFKDYTIPYNEAQREWSAEWFNIEKDFANREAGYAITDPNYNHSYSQPDFGFLEDWRRYSFYRVYRDNGSGTPVGYVQKRQAQMYIAHRGMVNLKLGINENTIDAVQNAINNGLYMVEIDVQAPVEGLAGSAAIATHDDALIRTTRLSGNVRDKTVPYIIYTDLTNFTGTRITTIQNPNYTYSNSQPFFCAKGNAIVTLQTLVDFTGGLTVPNYPATNGPRGTCKVGEIGRRITWFLDPKNDRSAVASINFVLQRVSKEKFYIKAYTDFYTQYGNTPADAVRYLKDGINITNPKLSLVQIMPVIPIRKYLDSTETLTSAQKQENAVVYALSVLKAYSDGGFAIGAVEFPGAIDAKWTDTVREIYRRINLNPNLYYNNNPMAAAGPFLPTAKMAPVLSYGYRFPDFQANGVSYDWEMNGQTRKVDSNTGRQRIGFAFTYANSLCENGYSLHSVMAGTAIRQAGCFVTHDYPHIEAAHTQWNMKRDGRTASTYIGAPQTNMGTYTLPANRYP